MTNEYYIGQGKLYIEKYENGQLQPQRWLGNVPELSLETEIETKDHKESHTGQFTTDKKIIVGKKVNVNFTIEEITTENLAMAFSGDVKVTKGASVSEEEIQSISKGENYRLKHQNVSSVAIKDANEQPLVEGKDYVLHAKHGRITYISDSQSLQMPLKVDYSHADNIRIDFFSTAQAEYRLVFEGLNVAKDNEPITVIIHKIALDPASTFALIGDDFGQFEIKGEALATEEGLVSVVK